MPNFDLTLTLRHLFLWVSAIVSGLILGCESPQKEEVFHGVSLVGTRQMLMENQVMPLKQLGTSHVALMPFGFMRTERDSVIWFDMDRQWFGERAEGVKQYAGTLRTEGIAYMIKPHLWIGRGVFPGELGAHSEAGWKALECSYTDYIMWYASLAATLEAPLFCLGTEIDLFARERPQYFRNLIASVRRVYPGKITYAANWDAFHQIPFWEELDYIGVDAYFPLDVAENPNKEALTKSWAPHFDSLKSLSEQTGKPVLFTEYGYRSRRQAFKEPWKSDRTEGDADMTAQALALETLYDLFWNEPWFAGGFLWKWFPDHENAGGPENNRFTIQNKQAEEVVRARYLNGK